MPRIIDLDDPANADVVVVVAIDRVRMAVSRGRLVELLVNEQGYLTASGRAREEEPPAVAKSAPAAVVTHASLSYRIRQIHRYASDGQRLRGAHVSMIRDLIRGFDWVLPEHPNSRLDVQLIEMLAWPKVPADFKQEVEDFLKKYGQLRRRAGGVRAGP